MSRADSGSGDRRRGSVRVRGGSLQVRVFAGVDPVTRKDRYLSASVKGADRAARREAEKVALLTEHKRRCAERMQALSGS